MRSLVDGLDGIVSPCKTLRAIVAERMRWKVTTENRKEVEGKG